MFKIVFIVSNSLAGEPVDLTPPYTADDSATDPDYDSAANSATIISYADEDQRFSDLPWSQVFIGNNNGDDLLEDGEKAEITVRLMDRITGTAVDSNSSIAFVDGLTANGGGSNGVSSTDTLVTKSTRFVIELTPQLGSPLTIQRAIPPGLRNVMNLNYNLVRYGRPYVMHLDGSRPDLAQTAGQLQASRTAHQAFPPQ